jgi:outer membrane protein TolC
MITRDVLTQAETALKAAELKLTRVQLNLLETSRTAVTANDAVTAPLVEGRDFVKERLNLDLMLAQRQLADAEQAAAEAERRVQSGMIDQLAGLQAQMELARARSELELLMNTVELRTRFLEQKQQPAAVAYELQLLSAQARLQQTRITHDLQSKRLERMREMHRVGRLSQLDLLRAEVAIVEAEAQLRQLERELQVLQSGRGREHVPDAPAGAPS